jgi:hypothetical protein
MYARLVVVTAQLGALGLLPVSIHVDSEPPLSLSVTGGNPTLTIDSAIAGSDPVAVTHNATSLGWSTNGSSNTFKIVVSTACPGQSFSLYVEATGVVEGTAQPEVSLVHGMAPSDLVRSIGKNKTGGAASLQYRAVATAAQGTSTENGDDVHTLTFTITAQ